MAKINKNSDNIDSLDSNFPAQTLSSGDHTGRDTLVDTNKYKIRTHKNVIAFPKKYTKIYNDKYAGMNTKTIADKFSSTDV